MNKELTLPEEFVSIKTKLNFSIGSLANDILNGFVFANLTFFYQINIYI